MRARLTLLLVCLAAPALAAPADELRCRATIGAYGRVAVADALRRLDACHQQRDGAAGACNGAQQATIQTDLARVAARCAAAPAARAAYPGGDATAALAALIDSEVRASGAALQGETAFGDVGRQRACHRAVGRQRSRIVRSMLTRAVACQRGVDAIAPLDALAAACAPDGGVVAARAARAIAAACDGVDGAAIGSCAPLPGCAVDGAVASGAALAATLYGAAAGAAVSFDSNTDLADAAAFYDLPYPIDLRLRADGTPDLTAFPIAASSPFVAAVKSIAERRPAFPAVPVVYTRFSGPVAARDITEIIPAELAQPLLLIDVEPSSPQRGRLFPLIATNPPPDAYVPANALAVATLPGVSLPPGRRYALVVRRALGDAAGAPLGVPMALLQLRAGGTPPGAHGAALRSQFAPLWETLDLVGVARDTVAAATVFSVGDVVAEFAAQSSALLARDPVEIADLVLDEIHPRFCELRGTITLPQYQRGTPPYPTLGDWAFGPDGLPLVQRMEPAPLVITIPRQPMPAGGYPMVQYVHGSGGLAAQVVDRGPVLSSGGTPVPGEGPAHVLAAHGLATVAAAMPLNPERLPGADSRAYLNLSNLAAYPYTFRQGTIEQRLLLDALERLRIDPVLLATCGGAALPGGDSAYRLRTDRIVAQGQSMGGQYVNYFAAVEPRVRGLIPTGSGGLWGLVVLVASVADFDTRPLVGPVLLGTMAPVTHLHPGMALLETSWEWAETVVFAARLAENPLPGQPARDIYQPVGLDDPEFPNQIYAAMAVASGTQRAGAATEPLLPASLTAVGRGAEVPYPVAANLVSGDGTPYTGVVAPYVGDGIIISHHIAFQLDEVKFQYGCFARNVLADGHPLVPAPAPLGAPCS